MPQPVSISSADLVWPRSLCAPARPLGRPRHDGLRLTGVEVLAVLEVGGGRPQAIFCVDELGRRSFTTGRLTPESMDLAVRALAGAPAMLARTVPSRSALMTAPRLRCGSGAASRRRLLISRPCL